MPTGSTEGRLARRMTQLDGLRALAMLVVVVWHYAPVPNWPLDYMPAALGVRLFFVLSGFLITGTLLRDADRAQSLSALYLAFSLRRALRLYPALCMTLAAAWLLEIDQIRGTVGWHLTYLTNAYVAWTGNWAGAASHLWSLAVEEQFYLLWPAVLFLSPRRALPSIMCTIVVGSFLFRWIWLESGLGWISTYVLLPGSADALALGALLALLGDRRRLIATISIVGLAAWAISGAACPRGCASATWLGLHMTGAAMAFVWVVARASTGLGGATGALLDCPGLRYLGRISYGIYVMHQFVPAALAGLELGPVALGCLSSLVSVMLAAVSWHLVERPIGRLARSATIVQQAPVAPMLVHADPSVAPLRGDHALSITAPPGG